MRLFKFGFEVNFERRLKPLAHFSALNVCKQNLNNLFFKGKNTTMIVKLRFGKKLRFKNHQHLVETKFKQSLSIKNKVKNPKEKEMETLFFAFFQSQSRTFDLILRPLFERKIMLCKFKHWK